ncbi:cupin domain-containing protein [Candidatus Parcubacteria bacterium]|nr:MAG: cupin domain-containing protein [Candidatus Parcubacteria bacterium]
MSDFPTRETPWGKEVLLWGGLGAPVTVKILTVNPGQRFSLQRHRHRMEHWTVLSPEGGIIRIGDQEYPAEQGKEFTVPAGALHRMTAPQGGELSVLEIATGKFDQDDIERLEDDYGRVAQR